MAKIRKFITKIKKSANVVPQDSIITMDIEEDEQERFEDDAAATILSLLRKKPEEDILKPYYDHSDFVLEDASQKLNQQEQIKKDIPLEHKLSLMDILKGPAIEKESIKPKTVHKKKDMKGRDANVKNLLKILKNSPVPTSDDEKDDLDTIETIKPFKFNLDSIHDILGDESE